MSQVTVLPLFEESDIEDIRVIFKAKGRHYSIVPKNDCYTREESRELRIALGKALLQFHDIVDMPLEDIKSSLKPIT